MSPQPKRHERPASPASPALRSIVRATLGVALVVPLAPLAAALAPQVPAADVAALPLDTGRIAVQLPAGQRPAANTLGFEPTSVGAWPVADWWLVGLPPAERDELGVRLRVDGLAASGTELFASPVLLAPGGEPIFATPFLLVRFDSGWSPIEAEARLEASGRIAQRTWGGLQGAYRVELVDRSGFAALARARELADLPGVVFAEVDLVYTGRAAGLPNDPLLADSWALFNTGQAGGVVDVDLDALEAWTSGGGHPGIHVTVIDDGVEQSHPDLMLVPGADFTGEGGGGGPVNACDNHGTTVAGCIAGAADNGLGTAGVAPGCRVASARVFISLPACDGSWTTMTSWTVDALGWAETSGARVTNNSNVYSVTSAAIDQKYADTRTAGLVHFAAAGDTGLAVLGYPANLVSVNAVSAIDRTGQLDSLSTHGPGLAFCAPGKAIPTTDRSGAAGYGPADHATLDGSSFASAYAAGVAALALSRNGFLDAAATELALQQGATDLGALGLDDLYGWGLVNARETTLLAAAGGATERCHVSSTGVQPNKDAYFPTLTPDGRYLAFDSTATNLVAGDTNNHIDGFLHDRLTGETFRITVSSTGEQADENAGDVDPSADGRYVAFDSRSTNLVPGDTNGTADAFVHDRLTGTTERVSLTHTGGQGDGYSFIPAISHDGSRVCFRSNSTNLVPADVGGNFDAFVRDRVAGTTVRVSVSSAGVEGNAQSNSPKISGDGRYVAYQSQADNLVAGDTNGFADIFLHDLETQTTERASIGNTGAQGNGHSVHCSVSDDGRYVCFGSGADNLVAGDTNGVYDVFVRDRVAGSTVRISVDSAGAQANHESRLPRISGNGRVVAFYCRANNLVPGDTNGTWDVFVHDLDSGDTERVSVDSNGNEPQGPFTGSTFCSVSWDGRFAAYENELAGLVPGDTNGVYDIFVRDRLSSISWTDLGHGNPGAAGVPVLAGWGGLAVRGSTEFRVEGAATQAIGVHLLGLNQFYLPLFGGVLVPSLEQLTPFATDPTGAGVVTISWPTNVPSGLELFSQCWIVDPGAAEFLAATNGLGSQSY